MSFKFTDSSFGFKRNKKNLIKYFMLYAYVNYFIT